MQMKAFGKLAVAATALAAAPAFAAQIHTDELSKCLVAKSDAGDRTLLVQWIFSAMSVHPAVREAGTFSGSKRQELNTGAARLLERLMLEDCRSETVAAVRYDGAGAIEKAFGVLGEVAMTDLMAHPDVNKELDAMASQVDKERLGALGREAAAPTPPKKPAAR
jgi:hypothetical protein